MKALLKSLFFSFDLERIIEDVPKSCLVCTASEPKFLRHQIGMQRSSTFFPIEHLVIDSAYLNASTEQFSKLLILAHQCTGRLSALPVRNLKSSSILRMLQLYPYCNPHPRQISCDMGTEFSVNLDKFLQPLNFRLTSDGTGIKSTTTVAEMSIRLFKTSARRVYTIPGCGLSTCHSVYRSLTAFHCTTQEFLAISFSLIQTSTRV